ncbi:hypothetical protein ABPG74_006114 [Tetrahymena malaccensis]
MNSESELHKSQMTNSPSPNADVIDKKKKTKDNIILVNQKQNGGGGGAISKPQNTSASSADLRVQQHKENINSTNQMIMGPFEKSILKDHFYGFPNQQQNVSQSSSTSTYQTAMNIVPHLNGQPNQINQLGKLPDYNKNTNYYQEFWKMYYTNEVIISKLNEYKKEIQQIRDKADKLEQMITHLDDDISREQDSKSQTNTVQKAKKKNRRCAQDIQKDFQCPYDNCTKTYGSEVSLNLHIKIKHNGGNKTERERLARQIFAAKINGEEIPEMSLNLPPGFMEEINSGGANKNEYYKKNPNKDKDNKTSNNDKQSESNQTSSNK